MGNLVTLSEDQRLDFYVLIVTPYFRFDEKYFRNISFEKMIFCYEKASKTPQELATDYEQLTNLVFPDYSV